MKRVHTWFLTRMNVLLTTLVALLGCSSRRAVAEGEARRPMAVMYGVPNAVYHISGRVHSQGQPVQNATVVVKRNNQAVMDTVQTDAEGRYKVDYDGFPTDTIRVVVEGKDSVLIPTREGKDSKGFYLGETEYEGDVEL